MFGFAMRHAARGCFKHSGLCVVVLLAGTFATPARGQRLLTGRDDAASDVRDFPRHIEEFQVPHSNALHARLDGGGRGPYVVGPLARYTLNHDRLSPLAQQAESS